jgi:hypothetical protein
MSNANVSFIGQVNGAGTLDALHLKVWAGEVISSFNTAVKFRDKQTVREIQSGKSAQFPATGKITAAYHTPGSELVGTTINQNERVITIDDLLIADVFVGNLDEAKSHFDVRSEYTNQLGDALAQAFDTNSSQVGILAARASATITGQAGGASVISANVRTVGADLSAAMFDAAEDLDNADVPEADRYAFVLPAQYYLAVQQTDLINKDYAGLGSIAMGMIDSVAGLKIVKTNNLAQTNITTGPSAYQGDFTGTAFLVMQRGAIGTVQLMSLAMESAYDIRRQGTLMVAKYALGHGVLRPHCAVEVKVA